MALRYSDLCMTVKPCLLWLPKWTSKGEGMIAIWAIATACLMFDLGGPQFVMV